MTQPLYELAGQYLTLLDAADRGDDVSEALATLDDAIESKAVNLCKVLAQLDADAQAAGREAMRLSQRRAVAENNADRLREYIKSCMSAAGIRQIKSAQFALTLSPGQGKVEVLDIDAVDPQYVVTTTTRAADKRGLLKLHKDTGEIPSGCEIHETTTLRIR